MASLVSGPAQCDWTVYAGDRNLVPFVFTTDSAPWDLTGAVITAQARKTDTDADSSIEAVCVVTAAPIGAATVEWDGELVRALMTGTENTWTGVWDLQILEQGETLPRTLLRGAFTAKMDVSR